MPIYQEIWAGPGRNVKRVDGVPIRRDKWYATIHNTSNDASARGEAAYAKVRTDGTGSHYYGDDVEVLQSNDTDLCVGHVGSAQGNDRGLCYEITGVNSWSREQWLSNVAWGKLAAVIARDCAHFGIPVRLLSIEQMRQFSSGVKGFITHDMARIAWGRTTHTDPGPNFPMDHLLALVAANPNGDDDMSLDETIGVDYAPPGYGQHKVRTALGYTWRAASEAMVGVARIEAQLKLIAEKVDIDPAELEAIKAAAAAGAEAGVVASVDEFIAALRDELPASGATPEQVEAAIRRVLGGLDNASTA